MIKWCELLGDKIACVSSYELQFLIDHQDKLTSGDFAKSNPEQYSNFVKKMKDILYKPAIKIKIIGSSTL